MQKVCFFHKSVVKGALRGASLVTDFDSVAGFRFSPLYFCDVQCVKEYILHNEYYNLLELFDMYYPDHADQSTEERCSTTTVCEFHGTEFKSDGFTYQVGGSNFTFCDAICAKSHLVYNKQFRLIDELDSFCRNNDVQVPLVVRPDNRTLQHFRLDGTGYSENQFLSTTFPIDGLATDGLLSVTTPPVFNTTYRETNAVGSIFTDVIHTCVVQVPQTGFRIKEP